MAVWEVSNPSDPYTMECDDHKIASLAVFLLGEGACGLDEVGGDRSTPIFLFGGAEEWFQETFNEPLDSEAFRANQLAIADALSTVLLGKDRQAYEAAIKYLPAESQTAYRQELHDKNRSSLRNIGGRAWKWAEHLRALAAKEATQ